MLSFQIPPLVVTTNTKTQTIQRRSDVVLQVSRLEAANVPHLQIVSSSYMDGDIYNQQSKTLVHLLT